jgi:UPF0755 protein
MSTFKIINKIKNIVVLVLLIGIIFWGYSVYSDFTGVSKKSVNNKEYILEVEKGDNLAIVGDKLQKQGVINNGLSLPVLAQFQDKWVLLPNNYTLNLPATPDDILKQLKTQSTAISSKPKITRETAKITLKEGSTADDFVDILSKNNISTASDLKLALNDYGYFKSKYDFLPEPKSCKYGNVNNCVKYYLEGYLYPDTYDYFLNIDAKDAVSKVLDNFQTKVWSKIKTAQKTPSNKEFEKAVIMASVIEKETGRPIDGVNSNNIDQLNIEKKLMAGAFNNRLENSQKWESDPTVSYGTGKNLCQQTLKSQKDCLYLDSPEVDTLYNTYNNTGYPIGAISSPTLGSIDAVLNPTPNDYIFFVSDASGKKYFAKTNQEHENNIAKVQEINKQYRN